jgi:chorismate lyase/3-hydroxybenzoate synthase
VEPSCLTRPAASVAGHTDSAGIGVSYEPGLAVRWLARSDVLAVIGFGAGAARDGASESAEAEASADPRGLRVGLEPPTGRAPLEVWRTRGPVRSGRRGRIRHAGDGRYGFVAIELDEALHGGLADTAETAYRELLDFIAESDTPHVLRLWNYLDAINLGGGDDERYRQFCSGRARGVAGRFPDGSPAATAIGRRDGVRSLQVYGLTAHEPGRLIENPRQTSAWRYPREYGPAAPVFARAMRDPGGPLLISGTAAVVGHASQHAEDLDAQLDETLANLASLLRTGCGKAARLGPGSLLKVYVRDPANADRVAAKLRQRLPELAGVLVLGGDICRRDLLVEIDGIHG